MWDDFSSGLLDLKTRLNPLKLKNIILIFKWENLDIKITF